MGKMAHTLESDRRVFESSLYHLKLCDLGQVTKRNLRNLAQTSEI